MRRIFWISLLGVMGIVLTLGACAKKETEKEGSVTTTQKISTRYKVEGDIVHVNNRKCAMSGSPLVEGNLEEFQSRVAYDGPLEEFKGKILVFNQCCNMCIKNFPAKWAKERDAIMRAHGLTPAG